MGASALDCEVSKVTHYCSCLYMKIVTEYNVGAPARLPSSRSKSMSTREQRSAMAPPAWRALGALTSGTHPTRDR